MPDLSGNVYWPVLCRALQVALEAAPTLLCGLVLAGLLRGMVKAETLRRWFTNDPFVGPIRAWWIGLLLPVCSFGVLPVAWELRRAGVPRATVLTFLLSAPLANPLSLAYAYQRLESHGAVAVGAFLGLLLGSLVVLAGMGALLGRWLPELAVAPPDVPPVPASEVRRLVVVGLAASRGLTGVLLVFLAAGLLGSGLLALYPGGALEHAAADRSLRAPLHMALAALPSQIPPAQGSMFLCEMLFMGVSLGTAFVFLLLGVGFNLGTVVWIAWVYGLRVMLGVVLFVVASSLAVGYALPIALPDRPAEARHGRHFLEIESTSGPEIAWTRAVEDTLFNDKQEPQWVGIGSCLALAVLAFLGIVCRVVGEPSTISYQTSKSLEPVPNRPGSAWSKPLGAPQLTLAGLLLVLVVVGVALYVYYPPPAVVLEEMNGVQIELNLKLKTKPLAQQDALRLVARWQRLQSKLALGDFLRRGRFESRDSVSRARTCGLAIERLRAALDEMKPSEELNAPLCRSAKGGDAMPAGHDAER